MKKIFVFCAILMILAGCASLKKTEQTKELMGTFITITVYSPDPKSAQESINLAFNEIGRIESLLSNYINTSQVYQLNLNGEIDNASDELILLLGKSFRYGDMSYGAFDITVQPILDLYDDSFNKLQRPPTDDEIKSTLKLVGYEKIFIKNRHVEFLQDGMKITLGGIAKGYAIDRAIKVLKDQGIEHALVNAGGDLRAIGNKGNENWQIALQNPRDKNYFITVIPINNKSVATSGDYERFFDDSKQFHHIIDPKTGYSATDLISVTIIADTALEADALATSVFVMGRDQGLQLVESLENVEGLLITKDKDIIKSKGFTY
jgi:thiamine biosynthesis lipoprotein